MTRTLEELARMMENLAARKFYGEIVVKFEAGNIVVVFQTESIKLGQRTEHGD